MARFSSIRKFGAGVTKDYITKKYGPGAGKLADWLLTPSAKAPGGKVTPAKVVSNTKLQSYMDTRYERKCGTEIKQANSSLNPSITTSLATLDSPYVGIAQGLTDSTRIGNSIELHSYKIRATFNCGASTNAPTYVRIIICKQGQMQAAALTGAAVLETPSSIRSEYLMDKQRSFTVLKDQTFKLAAFNSGDKDMVKNWTWTYKPKKCHLIKWTQADTTGVIGNMLEGNLQILVMYENPIGTASGPTCVLNSRQKWVDV